MAYNGDLNLILKIQSTDCEESDHKQKDKHHVTRDVEENGYEGVNNNSQIEPPQNLGIESRTHQETETEA
jgi:hypothetical protein